MHITYSISLWNYFHYAYQPSLERVIADIRSAGYGIELWGSCWNETDLYDEVGRARLKPHLEGMTVSLHTVGRGAVNFENHRKQIDFHGSGVFEIHPDSPIELATRARGLIGGLVEPKLVQEERLSS